MVTVNNQNQRDASIPTPVVRGRVNSDTMSREWQANFLASQQKFGPIVVRIDDAALAALKQIVEQEFSRRNG